MNILHTIKALHILYLHYASYVYLLIGLYIVRPIELIESAEYTVTAAAYCNCSWISMPFSRRFNQP
jgi:hypothetical protein